MTKSLLGQPPAAALSTLLLGLLLSACGTQTQTMPTPDPAPPKPHLGAAPPLVVDWYSPSGMTFGKGYSSLSGELEGTCVKGTVEQKSIGTLSANYDIKIVSSTQELASSLGITAEASVGFGLFSASAKSSYLQSQASNSYSVYVIVHSEIVGPSIVLSNAHIMKSDEDPSGQDNYADFINNYLNFYSKCGDKFLAAATTGATYCGIIRLDTASASEKTELENELKMKYGSASGSVDVKQAVSQISSQYNVHINEFYDGVIPTKFATDYQTLLDNSTNFPALFTTQCSGQAVSSSQLVCLKSANFQDYQTLALEKANTSVLDQARSNALQLTNSAIGYQNKLNDALTAQLNPYLFTDSQASIGSMVGVSGQLLATAKGALKQCARDVRDCLATAAVNPPLTDPGALPSPHQIDLGKPTTCLDYKTRYMAFGDVQKNHPLQDANYRLYVGNQTARAATIWCADMASAAPQEYISLVQPNISRTRFGTPANTSTTLWSKIKLNPVTLTISPFDFRYALVTSGNSQSPFGYTSDSPSDGTKFNDDVVANADLRGTNFQFPNSLYVWQAFQPGAMGGRISRPSTQQIDMVAPHNGMTAFSVNSTSQYSGRFLTNGVGIVHVDVWQQNGRPPARF
ncbi:GON domain-containing protein [Deinococcus marmoris]|uniref:Internalin A n=1 Tax=Deinococcus marmoris TaxID=249408 RepID=A0A1U7P1A0_9DEIO|nr:GON domain-containing protein [Deinococcus marmoris]OLV18938.1 internalin A [Deinococcus marmoris]